MREDLLRLIEIQGIDNEIAAEKTKQGILRDELDERTESVGDAKAEMEGREETLLELKKEINRKNLAVKEKDAAVEKDRATLVRITSNKEYKAIVIQIAKDRADLSVVEDELLEEMDRADEVGEQLKEKKKAVSEQESALAEKETEVRILVDSSNERVAELEAKRSTVATGIDPELIGTYTRLRGRGDGQAVASADGEVCGGCNMAVSAQTISELIKGDEVIRCLTCGRMLYLES